MILTLFAIMLFLSLGAIVISQYTSAPPLSLTGYLFVFILGLVLLTGNVEYASGETVNYGYVCGCCENSTFKTTVTNSYSCMGVEPACDTFETQQNCISVGCTWNGTACGGSITPCESYMDGSSCVRYGYCEWNLTSTTCPNGTSVVVNNETKAVSYSSYSGEIIAGIQIHHVLGFFMAILAGFGFVITLLHLRQSDDTTRL